ncbi:hypothetical protein GCM10009668_26320 [Nocardioides dubius]|uniref:Uncharacterized protein n=1 Tax=Nocardioides dubius TaxID=317019 RepID=A0ABN1TYE7_9ACTN
MEAEPLGPEDRCAVLRGAGSESGARPVPESLAAVLEFGELFPPPRADPLPDMREVWARARARGGTTDLDRDRRK